MNADRIVTFANATPHVVTLVGDDGTQLVLPPTVPAPRVRVDDENTGTMTGDGGIQVQDCETWTVPAVTDLPPASPGTVYIVSKMALDAIAEVHPDRHDFRVPHDVVRDSDGKPVGARRLARTRRP